MGAKKKYKGVVIQDFNVGSGKSRKVYKLGDKFETTHEGSLQHLINTQKIK